MSSNSRHWTISKLNWTYLVNYDSNSSSCNGKCGGNYYCNCSTVDPVVNYIEYENVLHEITKQHRITNIKEYCLDRGIRNLINNDSIYAFGVQGYYGEEVCCQLENGPAEKLSNLINFIKKNSNRKCIEHVLELEYGFVLDDLKDKKWTLKRVNLNLVKNKDTKHINKDVLNSYKSSLLYNKEGLIVLGIETSKDNYRLIDGYHRYAAMCQDNRRKINIVCCKAG